MSLSDGDTVEVGLTSANTPATGAPTISGTVHVGETLTAETSAIDDADGLGNPGYGYQWVRYDETTDSDITGANSSTYTLVEDDAGNAIKVRVSFTDDDYNPEELTSGATAIVLPAPKVTVIEGEDPVGAFQEATVALVSNIGQTTSGTGSATDEDQAQAFTTGTNSLGYTLESVEYRLNVSTADYFPTHTVSIWTESSSSPGSSLVTLTNPASIVNGVNTYTTTDGIRLSTNTTYFIVMDSSPIEGDFGSIYLTASDSEDSGAASGWSIGDGSIYRDHDSTGSWATYDDSLKIRINGTVTVLPEVPADSSLVPDGLGPGDQFRLLFISSASRNATPTSIATYTPGSRAWPPTATRTSRTTARPSGWSAAPPRSTPVTTRAPPIPPATRAWPSTGWAATRPPTTTRISTTKPGTRKRPCGPRREPPFPLQQMY